MRTPVLGLEVFAKGLAGANLEPCNLGTVSFANRAVITAEADGSAFARAVEFFEAQTGVIRVCHEKGIGTPRLILHIGRECMV